MTSLRTGFVALIFILVTVFLIAEIRLNQPGIYSAIHAPKSALEKITRHFAGSSVTRSLNLTEERQTHVGRSVAMGCAVTTRKIPSAKDMIRVLPFFKHLLPSFCHTASPEYLYIFYMGYDFNDPILSTKHGKEMFDKFFKSTINSDCKEKIKVDYRFVKVNSSAKPAWAQNDALLAGYHDGMDYLYMVNDDTILVTNQWTKAFAKQLESFNPPNVGLVGPKHTGGNTAILTYHFTHRTHIDIFNYFYPRNFTDWFGDDWITHIYEPNNVKKMANVVVKHTLEKGQRYKHHPQMRTRLKPIVECTKIFLRKYLENQGIDWEEWSKKPGSKSKQNTPKVTSKPTDNAKTSPNEELTNLIHASNVTVSNSTSAIKNKGNQTSITVVEKSTNTTV